MIVVVASAHDPRARDLVAQWGPDCALLSAEDLSLPGWAFEVPPGRAGYFVAGGKVMQDEEITGVLTLRPSVFAAELGHVRTADRDYVAAEMTAVLRAWLAARSCKVMNPPSGLALAGPNWQPERWGWAASFLRIPLADTADPAAHDHREALVMGDRCFGAADEQVAGWAIALSRAANTPLLGCRFTRDGQFLNATPWPALDRPEISRALFDLLGGHA